MPIDYRLASGPEIIEAADNGYLPVIPTGSLEQHCNGPVGVDGLIAERIAWESCKMLEDNEGIKCVVLPTIYYGFSPEWSGTPGTITLTMDTYKGMIHDILDSLVQQGFRKIAVVNGHGGNSLVLEAIIREWLAKTDNVAIALIDYWKTVEVEIGHASMSEQEVAEHLGIEAEFTECQKEAIITKKYKILTKPPKATIGARIEIQRGELVGVIEGVYKALVELIKHKQGIYIL